MGKLIGNSPEDYEGYEGKSRRLSVQCSLRKALQVKSSKVEHLTRSEKTKLSEFHAIANQEDITKLGHKELFIRMFELFAVLPNDFNRFIKSLVEEPNSKIYDLGCGGNNGIVKLLQKSLEEKDCELFNYQFDKCQKNLIS